MREILFRGKVDGRWIYGDLKQYKDTVGIFRRDYGYTFPYIVIPETVGQYTGLADKNGVKIFEGDIVKRDGVNYEIKYFEKYTRFAGTRDKAGIGMIWWFNFNICEVIGNIHDNPDLIGGNDKDGII